AGRPEALAPCVVHGEAPLRRGLVGDRELARRPGVGHRGAVPAAAHRALHQVRVVRRRLFERVGPGECHAPSDHSRVRHERQSPATGARRAAPALLPDQAGLQAHEVPRRDDVHGYEAGGILGRTGVPMVRRDLAETTARPSARTNATARVRRNQANDASSRSRERNATNPPNASPPAERIGLARPIRCSPPTSTEISTPPESPARPPSAAVSAASAGPTCSRGSVLPTT